jgi:hypothetical protein
LPVETLSAFGSFESSGSFAFETCDRLGTRSKSDRRKKVCGSTFDRLTVHASGVDFPSLRAPDAGKQLGWSGKSETDGEAVCDASSQEGATRIAKPVRIVLSGKKSLTRSRESQAWFVRAGDARKRVAGECELRLSERDATGSSKRKVREYLPPAKQ